MTNCKTIIVNAYPNSKANKIIENVDLFGEVSYKVYTCKSPEDGKANRSIVELLSVYLDIKKRQIKLIKGEFYRVKVFEILY